MYNCVYCGENNYKNVISRECVCMTLNNRRKLHKCLEELIKSNNGLMYSSFTKTTTGGPSQACYNCDLVCVLGFGLNFSLNITVTVITQ